MEKKSRQKFISKEYNHLMEVKKIVVIGPESTGKSTLCAQLAAHYQTLWVPEYAREYLEKNGSEYDYDDLLTIAKGQIDSEEAINYQLSAMRCQVEETGYQVSGIRSGKSVLENSGKSDGKRIHRTSNSGHLFIDTDMYVMKVWCEFVFNRCHNWILTQIALRHYDGYLLCDVDLPWIKDSLREYPDKKIREKLYYFYKDLMVNQSVLWCNISGNYEERLRKAKLFVDKLTA
jgi:nicotinamide riboside kinase